LTLPQVGH